jgi:hypothetical protein
MKDTLLYLRARHISLTKKRPKGEMSMLAAVLEPVVELVGADEGAEVTVTGRPTQRLPVPNLLSYHLKSGTSCPLTNRQRIALPLRNGRRRTRRTAAVAVVATAAQHPVKPIMPSRHHHNNRPHDRCSRFPTVERYQYQWRRREYYKRRQADKSTETCVR